MRKYNNFAPIGLKSGFVIGMIQFDIEISLICGFAPWRGRELYKRVNLTLFK